MNTKESIFEHLTAIAKELKKIGEAQRQWEREQIGWYKGKSPFDDFDYYIALSAVWQTFSKRIEGEKRRQFISDLYATLKRVIDKDNIREIEDVLRTYGVSRFMAGVNLIEFWINVIRTLKERKGNLCDPLVIQSTAQELSSRTQHWITYAPLEAAIVIGELFDALPEIVPPLGKRVIEGFALLGLHFHYPPTKRELEIIHHFLIDLAKLADTNHLIIEMGIWTLCQI